MSMMAPELAGKQLELLKEIVPKVSRGARLRAARKQPALRLSFHPPARRRTRRSFSAWQGQRSRSVHYSIT